MSSNPTPENIVDAVARMKGEGKTNFDIALSVGRSVSNVEDICHRYKIKRPTSGRLDIPLGVKLKTKFVEEAELREIPLNRMMRALLKAIVDDNLFAAILDDKKK